tara:strand:+ start:1791 stop:2858 length:1068 start_codon:yes stop_codon:yes gene_type:complete
MFEVISKDGKARRGVLTVNGKSAQTPFFMPVATKAVGKFVSSDDYHVVGTKTIITNAFLLSLEENFVGPVSSFMGFEGMVFTDNGGFQMLRENLLLDSSDSGVNFKNPYNGKDVFISPRRIMDIQESVGGDVIMALDCVLPYGKSKEEFSEGLRRSCLWTRKSKECYRGKQLVFGITQGGVFEDLRKKSCEFVKSLGFDGYSIGGLGIGESSEDMFKMVDVCVETLEEDKPKYLMGVGDPKQILECVSRGVDIFDSILPAKHARHGYLFTWDGLLNMKKASSVSDSPVDKNCSCFVCKTYTRRYLRYLFKKKDAVYMRLATVHNLAFMAEFMKAIHESISSGKFSEFKKKVLGKY